METRNVDELLDPQFSDPEFVRAHIAYALANGDDVDFALAIKRIARVHGIVLRDSERLEEGLVHVDDVSNLLARFGLHLTVTDAHRLAVSPLVPAHTASAK